MEIWKDIAGYDGYQVSNFGRVRSFKSKTPRVMNPTTDTKGYLHLCLRRDGKATVRKVHRLVAQAFIPNPENKPQVNHISGDKLDNRVENLEWVTPTENVRHAYDSGLKKSGVDNPLAKLSNEQILCIRENPNGLTGIQLAEMFGVASSTIYCIQNGKTYKNANGATREPRRYRISKEIREQIRCEYVYGSREFGSTALAKKYNCDPTTIRNIVREN